jgi:WD40 repeat protein
MIDTLLAVESLRIMPSIEGDQSIGLGLNLLPRSIARITYDGPVTAVAFSPDGKYVVSGSYDGTARVWEASSGREIARMNHGLVLAVAFSPDGKYVVSGSNDGTARVWEAATGKELARITHDDIVTAVAFSPDGKWVVSSSGDGTVRIWEAATGREVARMTHDGAVYAVAFSPDGKYIVSGSNDGTARVWAWRAEDLIAEACSRLSRNLTYAEWQQYVGYDTPYHCTCPNLPLPDDLPASASENYYILAAIGVGGLAIIGLSVWLLVRRRRASQRTSGN